MVLPNVPLPVDTKYSYDAHQLEFHWVGDKARKMARCKYVMPSVDGAPGSCSLAWVCVEDEYIKVNARAPSHLGELYVLSSPVAIVAGETIGYLGLVETPGSLIGGRKSKHQVHLEVFTQDPRLDDVLSNKANTKGGATYAKVPAELVLHEKQKQDGKDQWVKTEGKSLEDLIESPMLEKDDAKKEWVCVSSGKYVEKSQVELLSQHDWLKLGFKKIDGSGSDGYLDPDAPPTFFTDLVKSFDTDGNDDLSSEEILAALQDSGNAEQLHKLIVNHPSEWYEKSSASSYLWLDKLMAKIGLPDFDQLVDHEKQRIDKLEWMQSAVKLKFGKESWHLYPLSMAPSTSSICTCDRDMSAQELMDVIDKLRQVDGIPSKDLFNDSRCTLDVADRTYERLTVEMNAAFRKYNISTCIRRIHFIAQAFHETDRFRTTTEYNAGSKPYAPYIGRGVLQLTHKSNYKFYDAYSNKEILSDINKVSNSLEISVDSAGWFWRRGKVLSTSNTWKPLSSDSIVSQYSDKILIKKELVSVVFSDGSKSKYGTFDLGILADGDYTDVISYLVNGGSNGLLERRAYVKALKEILKYEQCKNNK